LKHPSSFRPSVAGMVIPLPAIPVPDGPPPPECQEDMKRLKWCVVAMIVFGLGRAIFAFLQNAISLDLWALVSLFISIVMGTFIFKDDEHLQSFYNCLSTTICSMCAEGRQGGLHCLVPFMMCTLINVAFDLLMHYQLFGYAPYGIFLVGSLIAQSVAVFFSYRVFKTLRGQSPDSGFEMGGGGGGGYARPGGADAPARANFEDGRAEQTAPSRGGGFVPFAGQGNRLGS